MSKKGLARKRAGNVSAGRSGQSKRAGSVRRGRRGKGKASQAAAATAAPTTRKLPQAVPDLAETLDERLARTRDLVRALHYVGYGLSSLHDDFAPAIAGLAWALDVNIDAMRAAIGLPTGRR